MVNYISLIVQVVALVLAVFWIDQDIREKEKERKVYWIWMIMLLIGLLFLNVLGIVIVLLIYYFWSKHARGD